MGRNETDRFLEAGDKGVAAQRLSRRVSCFFDTPSMRAFFAWADAFKFVTAFCSLDSNSPCLPFVLQSAQTRAFSVNVYASIVFLRYALKIHVTWK